MNKKLLSIFLIFIMLSVSLGSVVANQTSDDMQTTSSDTPTTSQDQSTDAQTSESEQTPEVTASDNQTDENTTENNTTDVNTTNSSAGAKDGETAIVDGVSQLSEAEYFKFIDDIRQANTNGQYDALLNILLSNSSSIEDLNAEIAKLSDADSQLLSQILEFSHDEYQSDTSRQKANKTFNILDDITDLDVENGENFTNLLKYFNDGRFDKIVNIFENHENYTIFDLYHEINALSDEDFESFYNFVQLLDDNDGTDGTDEKTDIIASVTSIPDTIKNLVNGNNNGNGQKSILKQKLSHSKSQKIFKDDDDSSNLSKIGIIKELIAKYLAGEITFDELIDSLEDEGVDTSDLKQNPDGSLSWFGLDSILTFNPINTDTIPTTNTTDNNGTSAGNSTNNDVPVDESGMQDIVSYDDASQSSEYSEV